MDYLCAHFWQQEESTSALVLKHLVLRRGKTPIVLGCLAQAAQTQGEEIRKADLFAERLIEWFYEQELGSSQAKEAGIKRLEEFWKQKLSRRAGELDGAAVLLCVGAQFVILSKGRMKIWLLNNRFGRAHRRELTWNKSAANGLICKGSMEAGVGILIAEEEFFEGISEAEIQECLKPQVLKEEKRVQKRLAEIALAGTEKTGKSPAAIMVVTC